MSVHPGQAKGRSPTGCVLQRTRLPSRGSATLHGTRGFLLLIFAEGIVTSHKIIAPIGIVGKHAGLRGIVAERWCNFCVFRSLGHWMGSTKSTPAVFRASNGAKSAQSKRARFHQPRSGEQVPKSIYRSYRLYESAAKAPPWVGI